MQWCKCLLVSLMINTDNQWFSHALTTNISTFSYITSMISMNVPHFIPRCMQYTYVTRVMLVLEFQTSPSAMMDPGGNHGDPQGWHRDYCCASANSAAVLKVHK